MKDNRLKGSIVTIASILINNNMILLFSSLTETGYAFILNIDIDIKIQYPEARR